MQIFISYSSKNRQAVTALAADLQRLGHEVWFDSDLSGGHAWWNDILTNIRNCDLFVVALTPQMLDSYPCQLEGRYAAALNKRILPVLLSTVEAALVPAILSTLQYVDYRQRNPDAVLTLSRALSNLPPASPPPSTMPTPPAVPLSPLANLRERIESSDPLSREQQATILMEIRDLLAQRSTATSARVLLQLLRERGDLLASVARDAEMLSKSGGRGRRTLILGGLVALVALFILGSEMLSVFTLTRKTTTPNAATVSAIAALITPSDSSPSTDTPISLTETPGVTPTDTPTDTETPGETPTETPTFARLSGLPVSVEMTNDSYVSGSVTLDCDGFVANDLTFQSLLSTSGTPATDSMTARVTDAGGSIVYEQQIALAGANQSHINGHHAFSKMVDFTPLVFTLSSGIEVHGVEKIYYLTATNCDQLPRIDNPPDHVDLLDGLTRDYFEFVSSGVAPQSVPMSGAILAKIRYKIASATPNEIQSGAFHVVLWVKRFADASCTVPIPVGGQLGNASRLEQFPISNTGQEDGTTFDVPYTAIDTPYIALQGYIIRDSDQKVLAFDYSTTTGCWKVAPAS